MILLIIIMIAIPHICAPTSSARGYLVGKIDGATAPTYLVE